MGKIVIIKYLLLIASLSTVSLAGAPFVETRSGGIVGSVERVGDTDVERYLRIPYAEKPVGPFRFRKTVPVRPWPKTITADRWGPACLQDYPYAYPWVDESSGKSEDCLYLNVWVPAGGGSGPKPVMVWIYGGGFSTGSSRLPAYEGNVLAAEGDVVVVTFNYRLGIFGFLSTDDSEEAPGNMGFFDTLEALKWVNENIQAFGGDNEKITLFGQSAGANTQAYFTVSPLTKGLFQRVIMESGAEVPLVSANGNPRDQNARLGQEVAEVLGCASKHVTIENSPSEVVQCLRTKEAENILYAVTSVTPTLETFLPIYGDEFMPKRLFDAIKDGDAHKIDVLIGNVQDEAPFILTSSVPEVFGPYGYKNPLISKAYARYLIVNNSYGYERADEVADYFLENVPDGKTALARRQAYYAIGDFFFFCPLVYFAEMLSDRHRDVYYFYFDHQSKNTVFAPWMGVTHSSEVPFVFGRPLDTFSNYTKGEANLSRKMIQFWTNYAHNGFPSATWEKFSRQKPYVKVMRINRNYPNYVAEHFDNCEYLREFYYFFNGNRIPIYKS